MAASDPTAPDLRQSQAMLMLRMRFCPSDRKRTKMSRTSTNPKIRQETIEALGDGFVEDVSRYVVPIFTDIDGAPVSVGTGLLLNTELDHVLVTAAHVLDGFRKDRTYYIYAGPAVKRAIAGEVLFSKLPTSGSRDDDLVDTAVVILEGSADELPPFVAVGKESLPISLVVPQGVPRAEKRYAFLGFPASKADTNRVEKNVSSSSYAYLGSSASSETYAQLGFDEAFHVILPFHKRNVVTLDGAKFNFPSLKGMSGSPLWELRKPSEGGRRVAAIMIRDKHKHDHVVVAADIWFALKILSDHYHAAGRLPPD